MFEVGTKLIRIQTGQHYVIEKTELSKVKGKILKKEVLYHLKSEYHSSLDLIVHEEELKTLFKCAKQTNADRIRAMTDEELASAMLSLDIDSCDLIPFCKNTDQCTEMLDNGVKITDEMCKEGLVKWLRSESEG